MRTAPKIALWLLAALLLAFGALAWTASRPETLRWAFDRAVAATGGRLEAEEVQGSLLGRLEIGVLRWRGHLEEPALELELRKVSAGWQPWSLLRGEIDLSGLSAASVTVRLVPSTEPASPPGSLSLPLSLRLRALRIDTLRVEPAQGAPIELRGVELEARYVRGRYEIARLEAESDWGHARLSGTLRDTPPYETALELAFGLLRPGGELPVLASLGGDLSELRVDARIAPADAAAGVATARLTLSPFAAQPLLAAALEAEGLDLAVLGLTEGRRTRITGKANLEPAGSAKDGSAAGGFAGSVALENAIAGPLDEAAFPVRRLDADLRWDPAGGLAVSGLDLELPGGGRVAGELHVDPARSLALAGANLPWMAMDLEVSRLDFAAVSSGLPASSLAGRAGSDGERFSIDLSDARRDGMSLQTRGRLVGDLLEVERARVAGGKAGGGAVLELSGSAGMKAPHALKLEGSFARLDPSRLPALLAAAGGRGEAEVQPWLARLSGRVDGRWSLSGTVADAAGGGQASSLRAGLELTRGTLAGLPASAALEAGLEGFRPGMKSLDALRVRLARLDAAFGRTRLEASGALGVAGDRLSFRLRAPALAELDPLIGDAGLAGALSAEGEVSGRLAAPGVTLNARGDALALGTVASVGGLTLGVRLPAAAASFEDAPVTLRIEARELLAGGNAIRALRIDGDGSVRRHALRAIVDMERAGVAAALSGGLAADGRWSGQLGELTITGTVPARLAAPVPVEMAEEAGGIAVRVGVAALEGGFGAVRVASAAWRAGRVELVADASLSQLGHIAETLGLIQGVEGARETLDLLSLTLRADLAGSSIDDVAGTLGARLEGAPGAAGTGSAELTVKDGALSGPLQLELPTLAVANRLIGPAWAIDGRIRFAGQVAGTLKQPRLVGDIEGSDLQLQQHAMGWRLRDGTLAGRFDGERFRLDSMKLYSGRAPGAGSVELKGEVRVADLEGRFDLLADRFAVLIGPGQRVVVSGRGEASSTAGAFEIKGQLRADEGRIEVAGGDAPTLPDDVVIVGARGSAADEPQAAAAVRGSSLRIASDITLDLGDALRVHGSGIDARLAGSLNLRGALPEAPRAYGTVRIRDGRYRAYGQELQITRGRVVFNGPIDNPQLDIVALRREQAVEAGVSVTGTALSPQVRLTSRPEVPDAEKLSWLVLGVPLDDARSGGQGAALQAAAATLFGNNDGALAGGLANALGLDMVTIRSGSTGAQGLLPSSFGGGGYGSALPPIPGQVGAAAAGGQAAGASGNVLAVGKRLSSRVVLTYEQGLHGVWNLLRIQYDITRRLSLRAQTGSESAIDLLYRFSFD